MFFRCAESHTNVLVTFWILPFTDTDTGKLWVSDLGGLLFYEFPTESLGLHNLLLRERRFANDYD